MVVMYIGRRTVYIAVSLLVVAGVLGGFWWHGHGTGGKQAKTLGAQTVGNHQISLDQPSSDSSGTSGGLSVSSGGASDMGQLNGDQKSQGLNGSNSSSGGSGSDGLDPSTFSQYDKYQDSKDALFADMKKGDGAALTSGKKATVYYKGWLTNGALIDQSPVSSSGQPQPYSFTLGAHEVIPGWEEGMYDMKAGGTRLLIVPPAVGYGSQGKGTVPPNAVLIFEVQLISVQ